ncbi:MAG TPA: flagellar hook protein [Chromatiales bacterium]|nr:flagellar hook protein [Chromatiales bacterium]
MANISSPGIGSGLDINGLVTSVIDAERAPTTNRLDFKEATFQAELSAYGSLKGALSTFQGTLSTLSFTSAFRSSSAETNNLDVLTADVSDAAADSSYSIKVNQLAQAQTLVTSGFENITDVVGAGTLTFKFGATDYVKGDPDADPVVAESYNSFILNPEKSVESLEIDETNNTLQGIRDAVNSADIGVTASIIYDGSAYRLTFVSQETGADNSLEVTVVDSGDANNTDTNGLSRLAFNSSATNLEQTLDGRDAQLTINGLAVTSSTNVVREAITGVTLNLKEAQLETDGAVSLDVKRSDSVVANSVRNFVTEYNNFMDTVNSLSNYDAENEQGGILLGDSVLRGITTQFRREINDTIEGLSGVFQNIADIGITTENDGKLKIDNERLDAAIKSDPDAVAYLFAAAGQLDAGGVNFIGSTAESQAGNYAINITQVATQGSYVGSSFGYSGSIVVDTTNDALAFAIDGIPTGTITLSNGTYTGAELANELQVRINGAQPLKDEGVSVNVSFDNTSELFTITSTRYGEASKVDISSVEGGGFGLSVGNGVVGVNVEGTIGNQAATGDGRILTGNVDAAGLQIEVTGSELGRYGSLSFSRGIADKLNSLIDEMLAADGTLESRIDGVGNRIEGISEQRIALDSRLLALEERMRAKFIAMDILVGQLQNTGNFLQQQLDSLPKIAVRRK